MHHILRSCCMAIVICHGLAWTSTLCGADLVVVRKAADPYGLPRPGPDQKNVPLRTTIYVELTSSDKNAVATILPESIVIELEPEGSPSFLVLGPSKNFASSFHGRFIPGQGGKAGSTLGVYVEGDRSLHPATRYTLRVQAKSQSGDTLPAALGHWQFTTEAADALHEVKLAELPNASEVTWLGGFFTGYCGTSFCTGSKLRIPTFDLMAQVRKNSPRAWSLQRDFWMTGMEHEATFLPRNLPNIVRERETRHIKAIETQDGESLLRVEDFFGHEQYGITSNRSLGQDYHPSDRVLVSDASSSSQATVLRVDKDHSTVVVAGLQTPEKGWKLAYAQPLPTKEDPDGPGLFASGGCYLLKFKPAGTPCYFWGRLDHEWDLGVNRYGRRIVVNFADAAGDLSIDGRNWTTAKDYAELHEATRAIASHIIERYGDKCLNFDWSMFNEPDLGSLFWRTNWNELQKFYDYSADAILRAFEDHGYDSDRVFIGGLELGGIFGTNLRLREFLVHCSPKAAVVPGALLQNAAFADSRLLGKRSRRVEKICKSSGGRGSPCDFVSIHAYNSSKMMSDKLARAKEMALAIDPEYYRDLWVNSHEACPGWQNPPDPAYADSYLGNGYFPTWCADVARRQLRRGASDARYARGETILTFWPWPNANFGGGNDCVRAINVRAEDGRQGASVLTIPMPILNFLGLLSQMGPEYRVLEERAVGDHVISGFVSPTKTGQRALVYAHNMLDTESRSGASFGVTLNLAGRPGDRVRVREYRFDKDHNSYFRVARQLREQAAQTSKRANAPAAFSAEVVKAIAKDAQLHQTAESQHQVGADGRLHLRVEISSNGANYLEVEPARPEPQLIP